MQYGSCLVHLLCSWRKEGTTYICPPFCETANERDHGLILCSVRSLNPSGLQDFLYPQPRNKKSVAMATVARYCRKTNQLQSVQLYGMQRTYQIIFKSKKQKNVLPWQHLLPGIFKELVGSQPCRGLECKELKIFILGQRKRKGVAMLPGIAEKTNQFQSMQGYGI